MTQLDVTWRGTTADERADDRQTRLLEAAFSLCAEGGAAAVTVRAVAARAGIAPRALYERFAGREALLTGLWDAQFVAVSARIEAALQADADSLESRLAAAFRATAHWIGEVPGRGRVMFGETMADPALRNHARSKLPSLVVSVLAQSAHLLDLTGVDPVRLEIAVVAMSGAAVSALLEWSEGNLAADAEAVATTLAAMMAAAIVELLPESGDS